MVNIIKLSRNSIIYVEFYIHKWKWGVGMENKITLKLIRKKQKELNVLAATNNNELQNKKVYKKSCELDKLIVEYMKKNQQMEIIFP